MDIANELVKVAKLLVSVDYRSLVRDAMRTGETISFMYKKKDGSVRQVNVKPKGLVGDTGFRGIDVDSSNSFPKTFLFDGIVVETVKEIEPVQIVLTGHEPTSSLEKLFWNAMKDKHKVQFTWSSLESGVWTNHEVNAIPKSVGRTRNGTMSVEYVGIGMIPLALIGDHERVVAEYEKQQREREEREIRRGEAKKKLVEMMPELEIYLEGSSKNDIIERIWLAINGLDRAEIEVGTERDQVEGPYTTMERVKIQEYKVYLMIDAGVPLDKNRMKLFRTEGREYWTDDEGNEWGDESDRGWSNYGRGNRRRRYHY